MIKIKESQLISLIEVARQHPEVELWDLLSIAGVTKLIEKTIDFDNSNVSTLKLDNHLHNRSYQKSVPPKGQRIPPGQINVPPKGQRPTIGKKKEPTSD